MRIRFCLLIAVFFSLFLTACSKSEKNEFKKLRFLTGGEAGTYYAFGSVIAQHATNHTGSQVVGLASSGSQGNVMSMQDNLAELAFCQSDVMVYAYEGRSLFKDIGKIQCFSILGALYPEQVQIVTCDPKIRSVEDLRGKVVSIGAAGSGVYFNALDILNIYGMTEKDIQPTYQSFGDSVDSIKDGKIDAAFIVAGVPTNAVTDLSTTKKVYLVSLDEEHIQALVAKSPYYVPSVIDKEIYKMQDDIQTISVSAVILVRNDVPEDTVYKICCDIFDKAPTLVSSHAKYAEVSPAYGVSIKSSVPYHPGAAKYFKEKGFDTGK